MERRFDEKTAQKALLRGYVDAQRLLYSPALMQKFLLRLDGKSEVVEQVGEPLAPVPVFLALLRSYVQGRYTAVSRETMTEVVSALIYFVSPWDLLPDKIPGQGYADDAAVLAFCQKKIRPELDAFLAWQAKAEEESV